MPSPIDPSRILFVNGQCLVVNKLPGEAVEGARPGMISLPALLAKQFGKGGQGFPPRAVHRLDVPVSGCVLFGRTTTALQVLNAAFEKGQIEKRYWAIIENPPPDTALGESGELVHWLKAGSGQNKSIAYNEPGPGRQKAILRYRRIGQGNHYLFMEIDLLTGRHHQIRAQLAALGLHVKGDLKYGSRRSEKAGGIRLHARSLCFPDPAGGEPVRVIADPPLMDRLWEAFVEKTAADPANGTPPPLPPENVDRGNRYGP
jgi:23S rRNA pseudouridine1911/1915/1917 synthase